MQELLIGLAAIGQSVIMPPEPTVDPVSDFLPVMAETTHIEHYSSTLDRSIHLFVKRSDLADEGERLPIIYLLDAEQTFPLFASYSYYMTFAEEMEPAILVGLGYGTSDPEVNFRNTDYTAPAESNASYGGADRFLQVLEQEVFPLIEEATNADPERRTLLGQSLGGQLVLHALLNRPELFDLGIAINPALHRNLPLFLEAVNAVPDAGSEASLYVSSSEFDDERLRVPARAFIAALNEKQDVPLCVRTDFIPGHSHLTSGPESFRNAVRWRADPNRSCGADR